MDVCYEDNHIIIINKKPGEIVQGDKTGDTPLSESLKLWLKERYNKPGNVFVGVTHRLDRPVGGLVVFAKTSKALTRLNEMFREGRVHKTYLAIVTGCPAESEGLLINHLESNPANNKTYVRNQPGERTREARLKYRVLAKGDRFSLVKVELLTGRKHQIRAQLAAIGCPIRGDLKYGAKRSNPDGSISLFAHHIEFIHPVSKELISLTAPLPASDTLWKSLMNIAENNQDGQE